jgi:hypothetical protein
LTVDMLCQILLAPIIDVGKTSALHLKPSS